MAHLTPTFPIIFIRNWSFHLQSFSLVRALFWISASLSALSFATDRWLRRMLRTHWKLLLALLVSVLVWRIPTDGKFFHGLEYEDSYVYTVAGRQMLEHASPTPTSAGFPYSIDVCAIGNLKSCQTWASFPEHLIGYPYVISLFSRIIGYTPDVGSIVNLLAACLACVLVFGIALLVTDNVTVAGSAALVFAVTPVFAVYGLETSAEPFSNVCISLAIWFYMRSICALAQSNGHLRIGMFWCAYTAILLFSLIVKRENILLAIGLALVAPFVMQCSTARRREQFELIILMLCSTALAVLLTVTIQLAQTTQGEAALLRDFPLTAERLAIFVYAFVRSFSVNQWYGGAIAVVIVGTVVSLRRRGLFLVAVLLFLSYLLLYAFHIRSYYEMRSGDIEPEAALRFSMNLMSLWSLLAGIGIGAVVTALKSTRFYCAHRRLSAIVGGGILVALLGSSFAVTERLRTDAVEDEIYVRIAPARTALQFASDRQQSDYVITLEPLIIQMYADTTASVVDLAAVDSDALSGLILPEQSGHFLLLDENMHQSEADFARYGEQTQYLHSLPQRILYSADGFKIVLLNPPLWHQER
jgi:hypothetical protein